MSDAECVWFLQWALPRLGLRWAAYRKVCRQVCRRLHRHLGELGLPDLLAYQAHLERHPAEWATLETLTHITISRFCRDRGVFGSLQRQVLPSLAAHAVARGCDTLDVWSAGCASGEVAYTLAIMWQLEIAAEFPTLAIRILATDVDETMLARARRGCYPASSLRELPDRWLAAAFSPDDRCYRVNDCFTEAVTVARHDVRSPPPGDAFDLVLCRNLAFTYFDLDIQRTTAARVAAVLRLGGVLVLGAHETLPAGFDKLERWDSNEQIYRRSTD